MTGWSALYEGVRWKPNPSYRWYLHHSILALLWQRVIVATGSPELITELFWMLWNRKYQLFWLDINSRSKRLEHFDQKLRFMYQLHLYQFLTLLELNTETSLGPTRSSKNIHHILESFSQKDIFLGHLVLIGVLFTSNVTTKSAYPP